MEVTFLVWTSSKCLSSSLYFRFLTKCNNNNNNRPQNNMELWIGNNTLRLNVELEQPHARCTARHHIHIHITLIVDYIELCVLSSLLVVGASVLLFRNAQFSKYNNEHWIWNKYVAVFIFSPGRVAVTRCSNSGIISSVFYSIASSLRFDLGKKVPTQWQRVKVSVLNSGRVYMASLLHIGVQLAAQHTRLRVWIEGQSNRRREFLFHFFDFFIRFDNKHKNWNPSRLNPNKNQMNGTVVHVK